ncbi:MAG: hypothetical protein Q7R77_02310 [Candidatus Daviesbacteria bacterium]|nr:hypothetical protein [Candidatus Daviesbacteria bacterium]
MVNKEDIERAEKQLNKHRQRDQFGTVVSIGTLTVDKLAANRRIPPPTLTLGRIIHGREEILIVGPAELIRLTRVEALARKLHLDLIRPDCGIRRWTAVFNKQPVRITNGGLFIEAFRDRGQTVLETVDPWFLLSGGHDGIRARKAMGIRFI